MNNMMKRGAGIGATLALAALTACGGGGDDGGTSNPPAGSPEGVYGGALAGSDSPAFEMLVLENGEYWSMYGTDSSSGFYVAGLVQGHSTSSAGHMSSSDARDFGLVPAGAGTLSGTYDLSRKTISGTIASPTGTVTFNGGPIPGLLYNYDTPAAVSAVAGTWVLAGLEGTYTTATIAANGDVSGVDNFGCTESGTIKPRASGKNVYDVDLTEGALCAYPGLHAHGIGLLSPLGDGTSQLMVALVDDARQLGSIAFGVR